MAHLLDHIQLFGASYSEYLYVNESSIKVALIKRFIVNTQVLYMLFLQFLMFQNHKSIMNIMYYFDPKLRDFHINMDKVIRLAD